ncbi:hypothetical protein BH18ACI1_BH18ACI1_11890 [soil metagenome]
MPENCGFNHEFKHSVGKLWRCAQCEKVIYREEKENVEPNLRDVPKTSGEVLPLGSKVAKRQRQKSENLSRK